MIQKIFDNLSEKDLQELHLELDIRNEWLGVRAEKNPIDAWQYQEIICKNRPDVIIECGSFIGGSALYLESICRLLNHGCVVSVDIMNQTLIDTPHKITFLIGDSVSRAIYEQIQGIIQKNETVMVILDSTHTKEHVYKELQLYSNLVTPNQYLIVEDTFFRLENQLGPMQAVLDFLKENKNFEIDKYMNRFSFLSSNYNGYLKKILFSKSPDFNHGDTENT